MSKKQNIIFLVYKFDYLTYLNKDLSLLLAVVLQPFILQRRIFPTEKKNNEFQVKQKVNECICRAQLVHNR